LTQVPAAPRTGGRSAEQYDFATVTLAQDNRWPVVSRYDDPTVQRQEQPRPFRRYENIHAGFDYPPAVRAPRGNATQTDFSLKQPVRQVGRRWNGLLLGLPANTIIFKVPGNTTYAQALGYALRWASGLFPTQFAGLRVFSGGVKELCLVAVADGNGGMRVQKNGVTYAVYLVDVADPNASGVRVTTPTGTKAVRLKT
jgi:hypothetical protein